MAEAKGLSEQTPPPRTVRVKGVLDMISVSTQSFAIKLKDGTDVKVVLADGAVAHLKDFLNQEVLAVGRAVYRPSGSLLRVDAEEVVSGKGVPDVWSKVPPPLDGGLNRTNLQRRQSSRRGVSAFLGTWPGEETDKEFLAILEEVG